MSKLTLGSALVAGALLAGSAHAGSVQVDVVLFEGPDRISAAMAEQDLFHSAGSGFYAREDFEGFSPGEVGFVGGIGDANAALDTAVGSFKTAGGTGSGTSVVGSGENIAVRNDAESDDGGRFSTPEGGNYVDSNDTHGVLWEIPGNATTSPFGAFNRASVLATDLDDVRDLGFEVLVDGHAWFVNQDDDPGFGNPGNGALFLISFLFDEMVEMEDSVSITFKSDRNDGISIDRATVGVVPVPAAAWLFGSALFGLAGVLRRRTVQG